MHDALVLSTQKTPIGDLTLIAQGDTVVVCEFSDHEDRVARQLRRFYSGATIKNDALNKNLSISFEAYFSGDINALNALKTNPAGSDHDLRVWTFLRKIPVGTTTYYGAIAQNLASSPRAVGGANGRNPVALIHPCHRVIGADGSLTGYAGGLNRKEWLLQHEGVLLAL